MPDDVERDLSRFTRLMGGTGPNFVLEKRHVRPDGTHAWVRSHVSAVRDASGTVTHVLAMATDISEHKRAEEAARQSESALRTESELLAAALNASDTGTFRWDPQTREFLEVDDNLKRLFGKDPEAGFKTVGDFLPLIHPEDLPKIIEEIEECRKGRDFSMEYRVLLADGSVRWLFGRAKMQGKDGKAAYLVGACTDITRRKLAEEAALRSEKMAAAGQLAASLAHEINNPLSSVTNALYLLNANGGVSGEARDLVQMAASELARVARIVKQSLSYYRVGSVPKQVDLASIMEESLQIFRERFARAGIQVRKKISPGTQIIGFPDEIRQVIDNLLLNAIEATAGGGQLAVSVQPSRNWKKEETDVRLTIADNGCGIPRQSLAHIFEPFFTTKAERGTGLGLWVVHGIVDKHEGSIKIRSAEKTSRHGTAVSILWPSGGQALSAKWSESAA